MRCVGETRWGAKFFGEAAMGPTCCVARFPRKHVRRLDGGSVSDGPTRGARRKTRQDIRDDVNSYLGMGSACRISNRLFAAFLRLPLALLWLINEIIDASMPSRDTDVC